MTDRARREYAEALRPRYQKATKGERGGLLNEYCRATGMHWKAAVRSLGRRVRPSRRAPGRPRRCGPELRRRWAGVRTALLAASPATLERLLRPLRRQRGSSRSGGPLVGDFELATSFRFGGTPLGVAESGLRLYAKEVMPVVRSWKSTLR